MAELTHIEKMTFLHSADLFAHCTAVEVHRVASITTERAFAAGEMIYSSGERAASLYAVVRGGVRLEGGDGGPRDVGHLQSFGVEDVLVGRLRKEGATAAGETLVLEIAGEDFFVLLSRNIEIVRALFRRYLG